MPKTYTISTEEAEQVKQVRKSIEDKQTDKRFRAVQMRGEGKNNQEIADLLETSSDMVSRWVSTFAKEGVDALMTGKGTGRPRNISHAEEASLLAEFEKRAEAGQIVEVSDIKKAYQEKVGHPIGSGQIYYVLKRHGWRKIKPRSRHPKKATPEDIEASKKLTPESKR